MAADNKNIRASLASHAVLVFDITNRFQRRLPTCHVWDGEYALEELENHHIKPLVQSNIYAMLPQVTRRLPAIATTPRFLARQTSLKQVPCFNSRVMKLVRDCLVDMYDGKLLTLEDATNDHVVPRSRGREGRTSWRNNVTTAGKINCWKANRTPEECGLTLLMKPWRPTLEDIIALYANRYGHQVDMNQMERYLASPTETRDEVLQVIELHDRAKQRALQEHAQASERDLVA